MKAGQLIVDKKHSVLFCFRSRTSLQYACAHNNRRYWRKIHAIASRLKQIYITKHTTKATDLCWLPPSQQISKHYMLKSNAETTCHKGKQNSGSVVMLGKALQNRQNNYQNRDREIRYNNTRLVFIWEFKRKCLAKSVVVATGRNTVLSFPKGYFLNIQLLSNTVLHLAD